MIIYTKIIMRSSTFNVRLMSGGPTFWLKCAERSQLLYSPAEGFRCRDVPGATSGSRPRKWS